MIASALPYFSIPPIEIWKIDLQPFGILVATGVLVGAWLIRKRGEELNLDEDHVRTMLAYVLVGGFIGAHIFDVLAYQPEELKEDPLLLLKIWQGISSFGGFLGGFFGFLIYLHRTGLSLPVHGDLMIWGLVPGFTIGRIGCTIVHDHPGRPTEFALGFDYPQDYYRAFNESLGPYLTEHYPEKLPETLRMHNLGMYELVYLALFCAVLFWLMRKPRPHGFISAATGLAYAPVRFGLEFLRLNQTDPRYIGLTFAQWMSVFVFACAAVAMVVIYRNTADAPEERGRPLTDVEAMGKVAAAKAKQKKLEAEEKAKARSSAKKGSKGKGKGKGKGKKR